LNYPVVTTPKKNRTVVTGVAGAATLQTESVSGPMNAIIDGLEFRNSTYSYGAVGLRSGGSHSISMHVINCVFENNEGTECGALFLYNVSNAHIESCVFTNNRTTSTGSYYGSASAILARQVGDCGVGVKIHSCVFAGNQVVAATTGPAGTIVNSGDAYGPNVARANRPTHIYNCTFFNNTLTTGYGASVVCREIEAMPLSVKDCLVYDAYTSANQIIPGTGGSPSVINQNGTIFLASSGSTDPFIFKADPDGVDNVWGTSDDGLRLKFKSSYERTVVGIEPATTTDVNTMFSARDVTGRARKKGPAAAGNINQQDLGAYESYLKVLTIGGQNTIGEDGGENYQSKLKTAARAQGYLIDFVGTGSGYSNYSCLDEMGEDPSSPNPVTWDVGGTTTVVGTYDLQMDAATNLATTGGTIAAYNAKLTEYAALEFDFALLNLGDKEVLQFVDNNPDGDYEKSIPITYQDHVHSIVTAYTAFANSLATTSTTTLGARQVLVSTVVNSTTDDDYQLPLAYFNTDFTSSANLANLGNAKYSQGTTTANLSQDVTYTDPDHSGTTTHQVAEGVESLNYVTQAKGFRAMSYILYNLMNAVIGSM
jgi:hypothetical protein